MFLFYLDLCPQPYLVLSFGINACTLAFCLNLAFFSVSEKPVMSFLAESNILIKKKSCSAQGVVLQGVPLVSVACALLLCFYCSRLQTSNLELFLPAVGSVWSPA